MPHIKDEGSLFDAPLEKIWKYLDSPEDHSRAHKGSRNVQRTKVNDNTFLVSREQNMGGKWVKVSVRITPHAPVGSALEMVEGPMAGSKWFNFYEPKGNRTAVTVVGEFKAASLPPNQVEPAVMAFLQQSFDEDNAALREFKPSK
jgi:hypothetical protein